MIVTTTTNDIPGKEITQILGVVHGIVVRTPTISQGFLGNLKNVLGGNNQAFTQMCEQTREHAFQNMVNQALSLGANAIVAMRYDSDTVGGDQTRANEVFCYGTAVIMR